MKNDNGYMIIENIRDFDHYEIIYCFEHKEGIFKLCLYKDLKEIKKCVTCFSKKEYLPDDIIAHNKYWKK